MNAFIRSSSMRVPALLLPLIALVFAGTSFFTPCFGQASDTSITFRMSNPQVISGGAVDTFSVDIDVKSDTIRDLGLFQVFLRYDTLAFGTFIENNGLVIDSGGLTAGGSSKVDPKYAIVDSSLGLPGEVAIKIESNAYLQRKGWCDQDQHYSKVDTAYQLLLTVKMPITDPTRLPKITFNKEAMDTLQYFLALSSSSGNNCDVLAMLNQPPEGEILSFPLASYDNVWDGNSWSSGGTPDATTGSQDLLVETGTTPALAGDAVIRNVIIQDGGTLDIGSNNLTVTGNTFGSTNGKIEGSGKVIFDGTAPQEIGGAVDWSNLEIDNADGVTVSFGEQSITGILEMTSGTLNANGLITLRASDTSYAQIAPGAGTVSGDVTYQMYIDQGGWHNITSPLQNVTLEQLEDDIDLYYAGSPANNILWWNAAASDWISAANNNFSFTGRGFSVFINNNFIPAGGGVNEDGQLPVILDITGEPHDGVYSQQHLNFSDPSGGGGWQNYNPGQGTPNGNAGWNLIPNPYPSNLDWGGVFSDIDASGEVINGFFYVWDPSSSTYVYHNSTAGNNAWSAVSPMQAFWVKIEDGAHAGTSVFDFDNSHRTVSAPADFYKPTSGNGDLMKVSVEDVNSGLADEIQVYYTANATQGYDMLYDAHKVRSLDGNVPVLFSISSDSLSLAIEGRPWFDGIDTVAIGFHSEKVMDCKLLLAEEDFPASWDIFLQDREDGSTRNFRSMPVYSFTHDTTLDQHRFDLIINKNNIGVSGQTQKFPFDFYVKDKTGVFNFGHDADYPQSGEIEIYTAGGQRIYSDHHAELSGEYRFRLPVREDVGIYIYKLKIAQNEVFQSKFIY